MTSTPRWLLMACRGNSLLHSICPASVPRFNGHVDPLGFCYDRQGRDLVMGGHFERLGSTRCVAAGWGFEAGVGLPSYVGATPLRLAGWNGRKWVRVPGESLLFSPPLHVHVEIAALLTSPDNFGWPVARGGTRVRDALLNQTHPVSIGWVRWYGQRGQLVLAPVFPVGGEWGGHLIFYFTRGRVRYAITLHSWMAALRLAGNGVDRVIRLQPGPALPHVIATLKSLVGSALEVPRGQTAAMG